MQFESELKVELLAAVGEIFKVEIPEDALSIQQTRKEFEGDLTVIIFGLSKILKKKPQEIGEQIGSFLVQNCDIISDFNVIQGFLNLSISDHAWLNALEKQTKESLLAEVDKNSDPVLVEYSSPNTNKPLHLGHIRNNLIGYSVCEILKAVGKNVVKTNIVNDRGIHICKSMLAWMKFGKEETPETSGIKGDHLVGKYYVLFDKKYKKQVAEMIESGVAEEKAKLSAPLMIEAQTMLQDWEAGKEDVIKIWKMMNGWVYEGFQVTYDKLGVDFDKIYYESETYLIGKQMVLDGLKKNIFYKKEDASVWVDLEEFNLDHKLLLRSDGTAVYITQDLGTALLRFEDFNFSSLIYVVGNEQDYHFKVLKLILKKMAYPWADVLHHLSYNMVDLPSGKMKSREGTVVDADDLMQEMTDKAAVITSELGKLEGFSAEELKELYDTIGLGALKYYMLKVDPEKRMLFNPEESIDFNGNTGPFIQYTFSRISSVLRKATAEAYSNNSGTGSDLSSAHLEPKEKELIKQLTNFDFFLNEAAAKFSPAHLANYCYDLAKLFNQFYHDCQILDPQNAERSALRIGITAEVGRVIKTAMGLLGIAVPERM